MGKHVPINKWVSMCHSTKVQTCADQQKGKHVPINKGANMCQSIKRQTCANQQMGKHVIQQIGKHVQPTDGQKGPYYRWPKHADQQMVQDVPINRWAEKMPVNRRAKL
jgi:hypothetical protein